MNKDDEKKTCKKKQKDDGIRMEKVIMENCCFTQIIILF